MTDLNALKGRIRKLKRLEAIIRFGGGSPPGVRLVWSRFFDLREPPGDGEGRYTLERLSAMGREEYKAVIDEYFARVYYEFYRENGVPSARTYDPETLTLLGLPYDAGEYEIKRRFRELAKACHPDTGGDAARFVELMRVYERLVGK